MATPLGFPRRYFVLLVSILLVILITLSVKIHVVERVSEHIHLTAVEPPPPPPPLPPPPEPEPQPEPEPEPEPMPAVEVFPGAVKGKIPEILALNRPPKDHHVTPLFIGFTRNWPMLQQAVVSYITAGWPAEDIYVVDNTGVMDSNELGLLTLQNPFFVDYPRLRKLGVNILTTPTLFTFAQLQNYFIYTSIRNKWPHFYWSHMDSVALSDEDITPYRSLYQGIIDAWNGMDHENERWGIKFFAYDHLALVNVQAFKDVGGWDTQIPFYHTDCDMHSRLEWANYSTLPQRAGKVFDVAGSVPDLGIFYPSTPDEELNGPRFQELVRTLEKMSREKDEGKWGRNTWQKQQLGGHGEPFYRDAKGFEKALHMWVDQGRKVFAEKWGHRDCDIHKIRTTEDAWQVPHDWEPNPTS